MIYGNRRSRILSGISANLLAQFANVCIQLAGVPILLHFWGIEYYGEWLLLFTIPAYLGMSDLGLGTVATTEISMALAQQNYERARILFRGAFTSIISFGILLCSIFFVTIWLLPYHKWLHILKVNEFDLRIALSFLLVYILLAIFLTLTLGMYRSIGQYGRGQIISTIFRIAEFISLLLVVISGGGVVQASIAYAVIRLFYVLFVWFDIQKKAIWFKLGGLSWEWASIRPLLIPSLSMTTTYLGQNLVTQGLVTIVGIRLGSIQVVLFSTVRTLCNFAKQMIGIVNLSVFTEFSISTGHKDLETIRKLHINSVRANVCLTLLAVIGLRLFGPWVLSIWTKGAVEVEEPFFLLYTLYLLVNSFWTGSWTMLLASNQHQSVTWYYLLMSCLVLITSYTTLSFWGLSIVPVSLILSDLVFSWVVLSTSLHVVQQSSANFIHQLFSLPIKVESEG